VHAALSQTGLPRGNRTSYHFPKIWLARGGRCNILWLQPKVAKLDVPARCALAGDENCFTENLVNKNHLGLLICLTLGLLIFLPACGDKQGAAPQNAAAVDQLAPRYESTLAEGIDFRRPGYPTFLLEVVGVSAQEDWGRWTDATAGPSVKFRFNAPLPKKFVLELQANAFGPNEGKPVKIRAGNIERTVTIKNVPSYAAYTAEFDEVVATDTIEITPPNPILPREVDPSNVDERKLGLGLARLKIKTSP
jgi:hypothetical protein